MKINLYILLALLPTILVNSQYNYLKNEGFEMLINPNFNPSSTLFRNCRGQGVQVSDWNVRSINYISNCGPSCGVSSPNYTYTEVYEHAVDLVGGECILFPNLQTNIYPYKGNHAIGVEEFSFGLFQQSLKKELIPGKYILTGFIRPERNTNRTDILSLNFFDDNLEFDCENDCDAAVKNNDDCYYDYGTDPFYSYDYSYNNTCLNRFGNKSWHQFNFEFTGSFNSSGFFGNKKSASHMSILYHGAIKNNRDKCSYIASQNEYTNFDEISLQRASCYCIDDYWIENRQIVNNNINGFPEIIQANKTIRMGFNVDNVTENGDVIIKGNKNIIIKAGKSVTLEPGTIIEYGSNTNVKIQNCSFGNSDPNKPIEKLFLSDVVSQNSTNPQNYNVTLGVSNATDYYIQFWNRWGKMVSDKAGQISPNNITLIEPPYNEQQGVYVYVLWLYNCSGGSVLYKGDLTMLKNSIQEQSEDMDFQVFPNPTKDEITIVLNKLNENDIISIDLFDINGKKLKNVITNAKVDVVSNKFVSSIKEYSKGIYFLNITKNGKNYIVNKIEKD